MELYLEYIATGAQLVGVMTKALPPVKFTQFMIHNKVDDNESYQVEFETAFISSHAILRIE